MNMNQVSVGTPVKVISTGETGTILQVFQYPTTFKIKKENGSIDNYRTREVEIPGHLVKEPKLFISKADSLKLKSDYSISYHFVKTESVVMQEFNTDLQTIWKALTSFKSYNLWFTDIQRILPVVNSHRYTHRFSFDKFELKPGAIFKARPLSIAPFFKGRIVAVEKEKQLSFFLRLNPLVKELVTFDIKAKDDRVLVVCTRKSNGFFSFLCLWRFTGKKSYILKNLCTLIPEHETPEESGMETSLNVPAEPSPFQSDDKETLIALAVNKALKGDLDFINSIEDKLTRGKAKSLLVKAKRTGKIPPLPDVFPQTGKASQPTADSLTEDSIPSFEKEEDLIAYAVNKALAGDMNVINSIDNKLTRGKAKSLLVKTKRTGKIPPLPDVIPQAGKASQPAADSLTEDSIPSFEKEEDLIAYAVNKALAGDMNVINSIDNKLTRGKAKSLVVKARRTGKGPPLPETHPQSE